LSPKRIAQVTEELNWQYILVYVYDIIVITRGDCEDHLRALEQVLERFKKLKLRLRREGIKCWSLLLAYRIGMSTSIAFVIGRNLPHEIN
jgi:hypothetical protein